MVLPGGSQVTTGHRTQVTGRPSDAGRRWRAESALAGVVSSGASRAGPAGSTGGDQLETTVPPAETQRDNGSHHGDRARHRRQCDSATVRRYGVGAMI